MEKRSAVLTTAVAMAIAVGSGAWWLAGSGAALETPTTADETLPLPPLPPRIAEGAEYDHCLDMVNGDPAGARNFADAWVTAGGGDGAEHCLALADVELGDAEAGADRLEHLAAASKGPAAARASSASRDRLG